MKLSKTLLCAVVLAAAAMFSSCRKNVTSTYSADLELSFDTTDDIDQQTIRQYVVTINGQTVATKQISGASFSNTDQLLNLAAPTTIDVQVLVNPLTGTTVPETLKVLDGYKVTCRVENGFATTSDSGITYTISRSEFPEFVSDMNHTFHFKLDDKGAISKVE